LVKARGSFVFDNGDLRHPFRKAAEFRDGRAVSAAGSLPCWLKLP
jgi:hypothetical protein